MIVDLTLPIQSERGGRATATARDRPIGRGRSRYTAVVYDLVHDSMTGTYLDFPGHIRETDDGLDAATYPLERLFRIAGTVLHLDREDGSGAIGASELSRAAPEVRGGALVINALGRRRFDDIEEWSVFLDRDAVDWIARSGIHLLVSDVYESRDPWGVFLELFRHGISTVCYPIHLHRLTSPYVRLTVLPVRYPGVTQLPCRIVAEVSDEVLKDEFPSNSI